MDNSAFISEMKNIEKLYGEETTLESWGKKISELQNYIEVYFDKQKTSFSSETQKLQKDLIILKNQLLYERYMRSQQEKANKKLQKKLTKYWETEAQFIAIDEKYKQQEYELKNIKEQLLTFRKQKDYSKELHNHWDNILQSNLEKTQKELKKLNEKNLNLEETIDLLETQIQKLIMNSDSKINEIYNLKVRLIVEEEKNKKLEIINEKYNKIQEELFMLEQTRNLLSEALNNNKNLTSKIYYRDHVIKSLNSQLETSNEKIRNLLSLVHEKDITLDTFKKQIETLYNEIQELKSILDYQTNVNNEKIVSLEKKYKTIKELNLLLIEKIKNNN